MDKQRPLVGIVVNEADMSFYTKSLYYIQKELFAADCDAAVFSTLLTQNEQAEVENSVFDLISGELIDGLIVIASTFRDTEVRRKISSLIKSKGLPCVFVEAEVEGYDCVMFDNDESAMTVAEHLANWHGVRTVCYVSGAEDSPFHNRVKDSFMKAFEQVGISVPEGAVYHGRDWTDDYGPIARRIISGGLPDAVVCCSDFTAAGMLGALSEEGIRIPEDVIVTGFSRNEPFETDYINITSIERRPELMSRKAVRRFLEKIGVEPGPAPEEELLSCRLYKGVTCGCEGINYPVMARAALNSMTYRRTADFDSYYNFMQETLISAEDFEDYLWKLDWYTRDLGDLEGFWLCLNDGIMHSSNENSRRFTDRMFLTYRKMGDNRSVAFDRSFDRREILPEMFERRDRPAAFIFNCIHFNNTSYGYTVLSYGDSGAFYDRHYVMWLRYAACALDKQRRRFIYNDAIAEKDIRDPLTGLLNVRGYKRIMSERCGDFNRPDKLLRVISVDVDNLKGINSAYGYREGDKVLQKISVLLNNSVGDEDICARISGDEFIIAGILDAESPVDEVPSNLERGLDKMNNEAGGGYGIHIFTSRVSAPVTSEDILDTLVYEANYQRNLVKDNHNKGRKKYSASPASDSESFDPEERKTVAKLLNDNLFEYHFQPIVDARNASIVAYEGLMRSAGGVKLSPIAILSHAAAMGRLDDVERHTMNNLLSYFHEHPEKFRNKMLFINSIPSCTLPDKEFAELSSKYSFDRIVIEFTEQTEASSEQLKKMLERSSGTGFKIAIDDYGTGYSNISSLLAFSPNCVKVDRSLIMNIHEDNRKQHFTRNIIDYAHDNNFMVLAEGVEKVEELKVLIAMGVDLIQGYLTARPAPEPVQSINADIADKIREFNRSNDHLRPRKTYFTGEEKEVSLMALDFDNFTDIFVSSEEFTIKGTRNHLSNLAVRIKDGIECRLILEDVSMAGENNEPCITVGKSSKLTLEIRGAVNMTGPINVPETASIEVVGEGSLTMGSQNTVSYGIGADREHSYGNIGIYLKNKLLIRLDGEFCVGIGGGFNNGVSKIVIDAKEVEIDLSGRHLICIGCIESTAYVDIRNTRLIMANRGVTGTGIGSVNRCLVSEILNCDLSYEASGDSITGISVFSDNGSSVNIMESRVRMGIKGKSIVGIGSPVGVITVTVSDCELDIECEGARAIGIGCQSLDGGVQILRSTGRISASTSQGAPVVAPEGRLEIDESCSLELIKN